LEGDALSNALVNAAWTRGLGFSDNIFPANAVFSARKAVEDAAVFVGFED